MVEEVPINYAIMSSLEETKNIIEKIFNNLSEIEEFSYDEVNNIFNIKIKGFFKDKEGSIILTPTQNGTNIFVDCNDDNIVYKTITKVSAKLI